MPLEVKIAEDIGVLRDCHLYILYYREHQPPHFHAIYGDEEALVSIGALSVIEGSLSPRARGLVIEWASIHQEELRKAWAQAQAHQPLGRIEPLR